MVNKAVPPLYITERVWLCTFGTPPKPITSQDFGYARKRYMQFRQRC